MGIPRLFADDPDMEIAVFLSRAFAAIDAPGHPVERAVVQKLDELRAHLARSALLSARLQLEWARIASETLAILGLPALVLDERGKVLAANSLIEAMTGYVQWRAQDRVSLKNRGADNLLRDAIATINVAGKRACAPSRSATPAQKR